jgi:hypothetical protein
MEIDKSLDASNLTHKTLKVIAYSGMSALNRLTDFLKMEPTCSPGLPIGRTPLNS